MMNYLEVPGVYVTADTKKVYVSDHVNAFIEGGSLHIENPTAYDAQVKVMVETEQSIDIPLGMYWQQMMRTVYIGAGESTEIKL